MIEADREGKKKTTSAKEKIKRLLKRKKKIAELQGEKKFHFFFWILKKIFC